MIAVNVGGALIAGLLSFCLLVKYRLWLLGGLAIGIVAFVCHLLAQPVPGLGIALPVFVPLLSAAVVALILWPDAMPRRCREFEREASGEYLAPQGQLIVTTPSVFGRTHLLPIVVEFLRAFSDIRMRLLLTDRYVNLIEEHVDLAVRIGELADSSTIVTRVGLIRLVLCASPAYLKKRGTPKQPADLAAHDCLIQESLPSPYNWNFFIGETTQTIQVPSRLAVNLGEAAVAAATAGAGIACVLSYLVDDLVKSRSLVKLLEAYKPPPIPVSVIYPSQRQVPRKLRAVLDFSIPRLRQRLGYNNT